MAMSNVTFTTSTWWEEEEGTRAIKYATVGAVWLAFLGIIIAVNERGWAIERSAILIIGFALLGAFLGAMGVDWEDKYLFSWDEVPGKYNGRLMEYLEQKFDISWVEAAKIEKIDNGRTIRISSEKNYLVLMLDDKENKVNLKIDGRRIAEFNAKAEKGKLNLYEDNSDLNLNW